MTDTQTVGTNGAPPAVPPASPPVDNERLIKEARDQAAAAARRAAEADAAKRIEAERVAARLEILKALGVESDDEFEAVAARLAKEREASKTADVDARLQKQMKQQEAKIAAMERQIEESKTRERQAIERRLWAEGSNAVLKGVEGLAVNPTQVLRILDDMVAVDAETGQIGIVQHDGTDDPPWLDGYTGADGVERFAREWLAKDEQANLRRPVGLSGAGSAAPGGSGTSAELEALEKRLADLRAQNSKGNRRAGDAAVALASQLRRLKAAQAR
jgi:flagellar biosynthesis GTPase FlhF